LADSSGALGRLGWSRAERWFVRPRAHLLSTPEEWKSHSFVDLSVAVLSLYISPDELSRDELRAIVARSYTATFRHPDVTPLAKLSDNEFVLELFHGPTYSFKDVALQLLGNLFEFFLARRNARKSPGERPEILTVIGVTSGDTGRYVASVCAWNIAL